MCPDSTAAAGMTRATGTCAWNRRPTPSMAWRWPGSCSTSTTTTPTIDQKKLVTEIHQPDGKPDVLQQLEHGVISVVGGYESMGRLYRGIIEPTLRQYVLLGDGAGITDNVVFDDKRWPEADAPPVGQPGSPDDRWVFTEENPRRRAADRRRAGRRVTRAARGYNDALAGRSLKAAVALYENAKPQRRAEPGWAPPRSCSSPRASSSTASCCWTSAMPLPRTSTAWAGRWGVRCRWCTTRPTARPFVTRLRPIA